MYYPYWRGGVGCCTKSPPPPPLKKGVRENIYTVFSGVVVLKVSGLHFSDLRFSHFLISPDTKQVYTHFALWLDCMPSMLTMFDKQFSQK